MDSFSDDSPDDDVLPEEDVHYDDSPLAEFNDESTGVDGEIAGVDADFAGESNEMTGAGEWMRLWPLPPLDQPLSRVYVCSARRR